MLRRAAVLAAVAGVLFLLWPALPSSADSISSYIAYSNFGQYCSAGDSHFKNVYGYPYAATDSNAYGSPCYATHTWVYWPTFQSADSGLGGAVTSVVGGSMGDPVQSDHEICPGLYNCSGVFHLY